MGLCNQFSHVFPETFSFPCWNGNHTSDHVNIDSQEFNVLGWLKNRLGFVQKETRFAKSVNYRFNGISTMFT